MPITKPNLDCVRGWGGEGWRRELEVGRKTTKEWNRDAITTLASPYNAQNLSINEVLNN